MPKQSFDVKLFLTIIALGTISLSVIFANDKSLASNQFIFWVVGLTAMFVVTLFEYRALKHISFPIYLVTLVFLILVLFIGEKVRGSVRWVDLAFFRFQPSEIAKITTIISLASFFTNRGAATFKNVILSVLIFLPIFSLIFIEPDIGSSLSIIAIAMGVSFAAGLAKKYVLIFIAFIILTSVLSYEILAPYQKARISTFVNPSADPLGSGYSLIQSKISVGAGQLFGRGLGKGSQSQLNFLPEAESDFIFASITEQLGFLGASLVIFLQAHLIYRILSYANKADRFGKLFVTGVVSLFLYQFLINVGMNMGIIPVTGITLPLVSYGGSSLISSLILIGLVFSIRRTHY